MLSKVHAITAIQSPTKYDKNFPVNAFQKQTFNVFMYNVKNRPNILSENLKVCLAIFQHYA